MDVTWDDVTLKKNNMSALGDPFLKAQNGQGNEGRKKILPPSTLVYKAEEGYKGGPYDHMVNFFTAIRNRNNKAIAEDAAFGYRAAAPALLCNDSYYQEKAIKWDPAKLKLIS